jgi:site-specific recombinase XerD
MTLIMDACGQSIGPTTPLSKYTCAKGSILVTAPNAHRKGAAALLSAALLAYDKVMTSGCRGVVVCSCLVPQLSIIMAVMPNTDKTALITRHSQGLARSDAERRPAVVYLARFGSPHSRLNLKCSLDLVARLASGGRSDAFGFDWPALRYEHVNAIRAALTERYAPASVNRHLAAVRGVLKECWRLGLMLAEDYQRAIDVEPARGTRLPAGRALSADELRRLFEACADGSKLGARNSALLAVLYAAGLRRSEIVGLSFGDWNPTDNALKVRGKGNRERLVYLNNGSLSAFEAWLAIRGQADGAAPIFVALDYDDELTERRLVPQTIFDTLKALGRKAKIDAFSPHDLRRSFISDLLDAGADIATVQRMAGHAKIETTARYDRRGERAKSQAATLLKVPYFEVRNA